MAHCILLFVGTQKQLYDIYADCPDSSSETAAEIAFGPDWINEDDEYRGSGEFTKQTKKTKGKLCLNYEDVINGNWYECYDIRDRHNYGDFVCINCPDYEPYDGHFSDERDKRNKVRTIEALKKLPEDQVFFFADSHW